MFSHASAMLWMQNVEEVRRPVCYDCICLGQDVPSVNVIVLCQHWKRIDEMGV